MKTKTNKWRCHCGCKSKFDHDVTNPIFGTLGVGLIFIGLMWVWGKIFD